MCPEDRPSRFCPNVSKWRTEWRIRMHRLKFDRSIAVAALVVISIGHARAAYDSNPVWKAQVGRSSRFPFRAQPSTTDRSRGKNSGRRRRSRLISGQCWPPAIADQSNAGRGNLPPHPGPGGRHAGTYYFVHNRWNHGVTRIHRHVWSACTITIRGFSPTDSTGREAIARPMRATSIGRGIDKAGDGRYDVLEFETRGFRALASYDEAGLRSTSRSLDASRAHLHQQGNPPSCTRG